MVIDRPVYDARMVRWKDADTCVIDILTGVPVYRIDEPITAQLRIENHRLIARDTLRLYRIDAAKKGTTDGDAGIAWTSIALPPGAPFDLETLPGDEREKYGRLLADLWIADDNINDDLVTRGYASYWDGHGPRPRGSIGTVEAGWRRRIPAHIKESTTP